VVNGEVSRFTGRIPILLYLCILHYCCNVLVIVFAASVLALRHHFVSTYRVSTVCHSTDVASIRDHFDTEIAKVYKAVGIPQEILHIIFRCRTCLRRCFCHGGMYRLLRKILARSFRSEDRRP